MTTKEAIEQAIVKLKAIQSERWQPVPSAMSSGKYRCPVCKLPAPGDGESPKGQAHFPSCGLGKALALLDEALEIEKQVFVW